ncbi:MAG TPA: AMP-binding protein, partial [Nitrospira sp.]
MSQFYWDLIFEGMVKPVPESIARLDALFSWRCRQDPQALAYGFVRSDLELGEQVTYEVLDEKVGLLASKLRRHYSSGSRVLLLFQPGLDVVCAFWASVLAGLIPVPAPCPDPLRLKNSLPQLRSIVVDAMAALVLTNQSSTAVMQELRNGTEQPCDYKTLDEISALDVSFGPHTPPTSPLVYLQYTSGSTAAARGVMISHGNVLAQCAGILATMGIDSGSRSLCWLPYFHDYGLVHGIIAPLYVGIPGFVMSPVTFLRRPLRWIEAIDRFGISHSGAPNFAYDACVTAVKKQAGWTADLRQWSVASCGAEPIHAGTIDRFCEAFTPHGF